MDFHSSFLWDMAVLRWIRFYSSHRCCRPPLCLCFRKSSQWGKELALLFQEGRRIPVSTSPLWLGFCRRIPRGMLFAQLTLLDSGRLLHMQRCWMGTSKRCLRGMGTAKSIRKHNTSLTCTPRWCSCFRNKFQSGMVQTSWTRLDRTSRDCIPPW